MIGNDIIDIYETKAKTNWQRKGFLNKIFTTQEQEAINNAEDSFLTVWRLWSIKESAYKLNMKYDSTRRFNPTKLVCHLSNDHAAIVTIGTRKYYANTLQTEEYIYSYVSENSQNNSTHSIISRTTQNNHSQIHSCHNLLVDTIADNLGVNNCDLNIRKSNVGKPEVYRHNIKLDIQISLTHHGKYAAYSIVNS